MSYQESKLIKVFINNMNTWFSNFLIEELRTDHTPKAKIQYSFMGTRESSDPLPYLFEPKIITLKTGYDYNHEVFDNDIIIFNLNEANLDEVEYVIRGLDTLKYESKKILILISNIMTWANTPLKEYTEEELNKMKLGEKEEEIEEYLYDKIYNKNLTEKKSDENIEENMSLNENNEEMNNVEENINNNDEKNSKEDVIKEQENEEENESHEESKEKIKENENLQNDDKNRKRIFYFNEEDYPKRIPYGYYSNFKITETMALEIKNSNVKTYVICPGFIYGCGEDFFFDYFKKAWLGKIDYFPIRGNGYNFIPTIHIKDLISIIKRVINIKPEISYIIACDKTKEPFMKEILESITKGIGGIKLKSINEYDIDEFEIMNYTELKINIPIKLSSFLSDTSQNYLNLIQWHCEFGIKENISQIIKEFKLYRQLNSLRIIISGPPLGGKSSLAEFLSKKYQISRFDVKTVLEWGEKNGDNELVQEIKQKKEEIEELVKKALEEHEHKKGKKKTELPLDVSALKKFPNDFSAKLFKDRIKKDECIMKGYILDNFPKSYVDCQNLFCVDLPPKIKEEDEENKEGKDIKENNKGHKKEKDKDKEKIEEINYNREVIKDSLPDYVILINKYNEESLKNKMQKNPEYNEKQQELDSRFIRRLETYKKYNESHDVNYRNLEDFFKENGVNIFYVNEAEYMENKTLVEESLIQNLTNAGFVENYSKLFDEEDEVEFIKPKIEEKHEEENILNINEEENQEIEDENNHLEENKNKNKDIDIIKEDESEESLHRIQKNEKRNTERKKKENEEVEKEDEKEKEKHVNNLNKPRMKRHSIFKEKTKEKEGDDNKRRSRMKSPKNVGKNIVKKTAEEQIKDLKDRENILLEKKSEIIRRYLSERIMPVLAKGVLYVSRNLPEDPVEALANFLMYNSFDLAKSTDKHIGELEKMIQDTDH